MGGYARVMCPQIRMFHAALAQYGVREIPGKRHNPRIIGWLKRLGFPFRDDETPWCGTAMANAAELAGLTPPPQAYRARSWLNFGFARSEPELGDVVVLWRGSPDGWQGHVGIFIGWTPDRRQIYLLGGNQGNRMDISPYPARRILGVRRYL